jgi:integrase
MATIRKRGTSWHVQIRHAGQPSLTRSFKKRPDAVAWGRQTEAEIDRRGLHPDRSVLEQQTVGELLIRYRDTVTIHKRSAASEQSLIGYLLKQKVTDYALAHATPDTFRQFRDTRLREVSGGTVRRQLALLQHVFNVAIKEWGYPIYINPVASITKPTAGTPRQRRLHEGELERLLQGCKKSHVWWLSPIILFAVETGMRRSEIVNVRLVDVDLDAKTLRIPRTKNGHARTIPLTTGAINIITDTPTTDDHLFPTTVNALRLAWGRLKKRVGLGDLRFHDLRHEAISRFFEMNLTVPEVALISGHRDVRMLFRYTHLRAEDVVNKLR